MLSTSWADGPQMHLYVTGANSMLLPRYTLKTYTSHAAPHLNALLRASPVGESDFLPRRRAHWQAMIWGLLALDS